LDGAFISSLAADRIVLPDVDRAKIEEMKTRDEKYVGGFVKHPLAGLHDWVVSFDATSLYPSIMMGWNISPETKLTVIPQIFVKDMMKALAGTGGRNEPCIFFGENTTCGEVADYIKENNYCMAANGAVYRQDKQGIVPKFVEEWFNKRKAYKKKMLAAQAHGDKDGADKYHALQLNYKILINSVYGYLGTAHSRFFDWDNAVAVTMSGRYITMTTGASIEHHFKSGAWQNSKFGKKVGATEGTEGTVIYADTDSVYLDFGKILKTFGVNYEDTDPEIVKNYIIFDDKKTNDEMGLHIDMSDEEIAKYADMEESADSLQNHAAMIINDAMKRLTLNHFNCNKNKIFFKREAVAQRGIFLERKRYVLWALNNEGVELPLKKRLKVTGIDIVRSNVPKFVRENLKKVVSDILTILDEKHTVDQIRAMHSVFFDAAPDEIAFTKTANNVTKYRKRREELGKFKSTPQQVRGAILYNELLDSNPKLKRVYDKIYDGDKMSYVYSIKSPMWDSDVFAFKDKWIKDGGYEQIIDRRRQFDVAMLNPVRRFFDLLHWNLPDFENCDMTDMFEWE
jgi:DNA polymerase elongation subunit (family B)